MRKTIAIIRVSLAWDHVQFKSGNRSPSLSSSYHFTRNHRIHTSARHTSRRLKKLETKTRMTFCIQLFNRFSLCNEKYLDLQLLSPLRFSLFHTSIFHSVTNKSNFYSLTVQPHGPHQQPTTNNLDWYQPTPENLTTPASNKEGCSLWVRQALTQFCYLHLRD